MVCAKDFSSGRACCISKASTGWFLAIEADSVK